MRTIGQHLRCIRNVFYGSQLDERLCRHSVQLLEDFIQSKLYRQDMTNMSPNQPLKVSNFSVS